MRRSWNLVFGILLFGVLYAQDVSAGGPIAHAAIVIQSDGDFTGCACVTGGDGSQANPFIIGPWSVNSVNGNAVFVDGSNLTKSFVILNLTAAGNGSTTGQGIVLQNINPNGPQVITAAVEGKQTSIQSGMWAF